MGGFLSQTLDLNPDFTPADLGLHQEFENTVQSLADVLRSHRGRVAVVTGAGISSHKLPTFRSNNNSGLWESFSPTILDKNNFYSNPNPCWKLIANIRNLQITKMLHPSLAHHVIHILYQRGFINHIITQNIDGLHNFPGDTVIELHGAVTDQGECEKCHQSRDVDSLNILQTGVSPVCHECGQVLRPPVAFFGDVIDSQKRHETARILREVDVLILVGTHCTVDPVRSMVEEAKRCGVIIAEINIAPTALSTIVDIELTGTADDIFSQIAEELLHDVDVKQMNLEKW